MNERVEYIYRNKRVKQPLGSLDIPSGTFDEAIEYLQKQKEYWQGQIGRTFRCYGWFQNLETEGKRMSNESHSFDSIYLDDMFRVVEGSLDGHYEIAVFGERDMTESEIAFYAKTQNEARENRRKQLEALKKEFGEE